MARIDPPTTATASGPWAACPPDAVPITVVRAELVRTGGTHRVSILRELRCGEVVVAGGPVWSRSTGDEVAATDAFEGLVIVGDDLVFLAEAAIVLDPRNVDAVVDQHVANAVKAREAARIKAAEKAAKAEAKAARDRKIGVYFTGDKKKPVLEMRRGPLSAPFLKLHFGAEWERDRFWDWFAWQNRPIPHSARSSARNAIKSSSTRRRTSRPCSWVACGCSLRIPPTPSSRAATSTSGSLRGEAGASPTWTGSAPG